MPHTVSLDLHCSSPDRYARGSANRLNAEIASTTQLGSPRNHTLALDSGLLHMACRPSEVAVRSNAAIDIVSTCGRC